MMMNARPAKFTFSQDFGPTEPRRRPEDVDAEIARLTARIDAARQEGRVEGYAAGKVDQEAVELGRLADAVEKLAVAAAQCLTTLDAERAEIERDAVELAMATAKTMARGLIEREPLFEITRVAAEAIANLRGAPHLVLRVAPEQVEAVEKRMKRVAFERGFDGRLIVLGDPDQAIGDCQIEWADGGFIRNTPAVEAAIRAAMSRYLEARAAGETE
jgi:flagellar assembly protein FliH